MLFLNKNYIFTIAAFGRKNTGKSVFLLSFLDRNDITILNTFENEDYYKVTYETRSVGTINFYIFHGFENNIVKIDEIMYELSSFFNQLDYAFYFVKSINEINDFDRHFIHRLNEKDAQVFCIVNKHTKEEVNKIQLYIEQGNLGVNTLLCNCMNRFDIMNIKDMLLTYIKDEILLYEFMQFTLESPKTVLFLDPISIAGYSKNVYKKYFNLLKSVVDKNGISIFMNKLQLKFLIERSDIQLDAVVTGDRIILGASDIKQFIK